MGFCLTFMGVYRKQTWGEQGTCPPRRSCWSLAMGPKELLMSLFSSSFARSLHDWLFPALIAGLSVGDYAAEGSILCTFSNRHFSLFCPLSRNLPGQSLTSSLLSDPIKLLEILALSPAFGQSNSAESVSLVPTNISALITLPLIFSSPLTTDSFWSLLGKLCIQIFVLCCASFLFSYEEPPLFSTF